MKTNYLCGLFLLCVLVWGETAEDSGSVSLHWTVEYGREREIITGSDGYSTKCIPAECR